MNIYPYVYRIDHPSGEFYIGSRSANAVPAEADLGHTYKTSTKHLSYPFEEYSITIIAEFFTATAKTDAYDFEQLAIFESWGHPNLANKHCAHGKQRFSTAGLAQSEESRAKISAGRRGKVHSIESKQKMSGAHTGKVLSEETRKRMSESALRRKR